MPDPSISEELAEAYALAPADEIIFHTIEIRHPSFVDEQGNPSSIWAVADQNILHAKIEDDAPVSGGQTVAFQPIPFTFYLPQIEPGATPEIEMTLDGVSRIVAEQLDLAVTEATPIEVAYRPYLQSDLTQPQMDPVPTFTLSSVSVDLMSVRARARTGIDLRVAFPRRLYTAREFPGLIGA